MKVDYEGKQLNKWKCTFLLVLIDQVVKRIIYCYGMSMEIRFFNGSIGFTPYINRDQLCIFNHELNMNLGLPVLILINLASLIILPILFSWYKRKEYTNIYFEFTFIFTLAAVICSLIDKIFYGGSLDFILAASYISDFKDIYILAGLGNLLIYVVFCLKKDICKE